MEILESLKDDHRKAEALLEELTNATSSDERATLCAQLTKEVEIHAEIEERILYPLLQEYDETKNFVQDGLVEHNSAKEHLRNMAVRMDVGSQDWIGELEVVRSVLQHHVKDEEEKLFPAARMVLSADQLNDVGRRMNELKARLQSDDRQYSSQYGSQYSSQYSSQYAGSSTESMHRAGDKIKSATRQLASGAKEKGKGVMSEQIRHVAAPVHEIARAMHNTADSMDGENSRQLSQYAHIAADRIDELATRLESADVDDVIGRMSSYARQHPAVFFGGAVAAGFALSRFLKSSEQRVHYGSDQ